MTSRVGLRFLQNSRAAFQRFTSPFRTPGGRNLRYQSTEAGSSSSTAQPQSFLQRSWNSPIGLKTVHFWAPVMKWILVLAGLSDMAKPADKLSLTQNGALMATGAIWTRWCLIITPRNVLLATVNFFVGLLGATQVTRIFLHRRSVDGSAKEALKDMTHEATGGAKAIVHKAEEVVKKN
ncbi:hypothetical protein AJ80_07496 [Polytolypa hystricis UAMH7299]|uniref:Mitochondrial pyruvate carrier n=1 Tax=Polytolypa hystricis (strain UAMH7299) TaxID=1447883 RepID=A0A2B7XNP8_POLH7|nr:hypothetical protein AJ80_07496 [Polytolypa hystricis UAMH7299]